MLLSFHNPRQGYSDILLVTPPVLRVSFLSSGCGEVTHGVRDCPQDFINVSGVLNPELGTLNDGGDAFVRWQARMRSHRRGNHENNVAARRQGKQMRGKNQGGNRRHSGNNTHQNHGGYNTHRESAQSNSYRPTLALTSSPHPTYNLQRNVGSASTEADGMRHSANQASSDNPNGRKPGTFRNGRN